MTSPSSAPIYGAERVIDYQSKRSLDPIASDKDFAETIGRCMQTIQAEGDDGPTVRGHHRFGLVSNPSNSLHDLARLTDIARSHDRAGSFVELVRRTCAKGVRDRLTALRTIVATASSSCWSGVVLPGLVVVASATTYKGYRYPIEIIGHAVWLYHCFALSLRDVASHGGGQTWARESQ